MDIDPKKNLSKPPFGERPVSGLSVPEIVSYILAVVWIIFSLSLYFSDRLNFDGKLLNQFLFICMPFAMICLSLIIMRASRVMKEETQLLKIAIDSLRKSYMDQQKLNGQTNPDTFVLRRLDEICTTQRKIQNALTMFNTELLTSRQRSISYPQDAKQPNGKEQKSLELGTNAEELQDPLSIDDFVKALNFPETAEDEDGFAALRRGLKDRETAILIQAAQDVLTLLSQDGIYMDDLRPDIARPDAWRLFAQGERGRKIASLGGIRDRSSLAITNGRMKQDTIFRDTVHHFLRQFDKVFANFEDRATDADLSSFSDTRTARAFMLVGRVAGTFD